MINIKHNNMGILFFINICKQNQIAVTNSDLSSFFTKSRIFMPSYQKY